MKAQESFKLVEHKYLKMEFDPLAAGHLQFLPVAQQVRNSWNSGLQGLVSTVVKPPSQHQIM